MSISVPVTIIEFFDVMHQDMLPGLASGLLGRPDRPLVVSEDRDLLSLLVFREETCDDKGHPYPAQLPCVDCGMS